MFFWYWIFFLVGHANSTFTFNEIQLELALCKLLRHTPNYTIYQLQLQSNCVSQVKTYNEILCLRNYDNKIVNEACFAKHDLQVLVAFNQTFLNSPRNTISSSSILSKSTSTTSSPSFSTTDSIIDLSKFSSRQGRGIQNRSFGSIDKKEGEAGLSTLTNADEEGNVNVRGHIGNESREGRTVVDIGDSTVGIDNSAVNSGNSAVGMRNSAVGMRDSVLGMGDPAVGKADLAVVMGNSAVGMGDPAVGMSKRDDGEELRIDSNLAFNDRIISTVKGPSTLSASGIKLPEEQGMGSSLVIDSKISSTFVVLGSGSGSVKTEFSVLSDMVSELPATSTIWPDGNRTENERLNSSVAERLTLIEEAAILKDSLKEKKEGPKVLCSNNSFYTFWLMVQALDTSFNTDCQIPTPSAFVSQQRLSAWHYKTNRDFYELHKSCFFKIGCTFIIVIIQVLCNKNYKCPTQHRPNFDIENNLSNESSDNEIYTGRKKRKGKYTPKSIELEKKEKTKKRVSIQDQTETDENYICGSPQSYPPSIFKRSHSTDCFTCTNNQISNAPTVSQNCTHNQISNVPPSFNLNSNQKSTPLGPPRNCNALPNVSTPKQNQINTTVDVHNSAVEPDQTFYSLC